ncbi:hypothetical protein HDU98_005347, partial [Podochytrium sp. JEL0797]
MAARLERSVDVSVLEMPVKRKSCTSPGSSAPRLLHGTEDLPAVSRRQLAASSVWPTAQRSIETALVELNQLAFDKIEAFALNSKSLRTHLPITELPVALILGENQSLYDAMAHRFSQNKSCNLAVLRPMNSSDLKACVKSLIQQFMNPSIGAISNPAELEDKEILEAINEDVEEEEEEVEEQLLFGSSAKQARKYSPFDIQLLQSWFAKKSKRVRDSSVLIVSIPEFERFDTHVFQDLIKICSSCLDTLPFVFLLGISTTLDIVHNNLNKSVIRLLRCERFVLSKSDDCIDAIVSEVFLKKPEDVKLSHSVFSLIFNSYKMNHKSVTALCDSIQYAIMGHFYANAMSSLITYDGESAIQPELGQMLRRTESFQR